MKHPSTRDPIVFPTRGVRVAALARDDRRSRRARLTALLFAIALGPASPAHAQNSDPWMKKILALAPEDHLICAASFAPNAFFDCFNYTQDKIGADWIVSIKKLETTQSADVDMKSNMALDTRLVAHEWRQLQGADAGGWYEFDYKDIGKQMTVNEHLRRYDFRVGTFSARIRETTVSGAPLPAPALIAPIVAILKEASAADESQGGRQAIGGPDPATPDTLSALDGLEALQMSLGLLPANMKYDLDGDQRIMSNDARLILGRAVGR